MVKEISMLSVRRIWINYPDVQGKKVSLSGGGKLS